MALKTPNEAYQALKKGLQEQLSDFKKTVETNTVYSPQETAYIVKQSIKEKVLEFQDSLVKMRAVENGEVLEKKTPPDISEELMHKLKRQYGGDKEKAYATAWSIHNKKSHAKKEPELDNAYDRYKKKNKAKKSECSEVSMQKGWGPDHEGDPEWTKPQPKQSIPGDPPLAGKKLTSNKPKPSPFLKPSKGKMAHSEVDKAEPGPMTSSNLLQVGHAKPQVPVAPADKHPKPQPALPINRHSELPPTVGGGGALPKGKQLEKNLFGLPGPAQTPPEMAHQLSKNVFNMLNRPVMKTNDVINTTFKAEDKPEHSIVKKPVSNPNATTDIKGKDIKDIDRAKYERELYELHHNQAVLPSDKLPEDANSKDTGSGGQIQKGKMKKDEFTAAKAPTLTPRPQYKSPAFAAAANSAQRGSVPMSVTVNTGKKPGNMLPNPQPQPAIQAGAALAPKTSGLTPQPNYKLPVHAHDAMTSQGGAKMPAVEGPKTASMRPGAAQKAENKFSIPAMQHKDKMMPVRQQSTKMPSSSDLINRHDLATNLTPSGPVKSEDVNKGGVNLWEKEKK